MAQRKAHEVDAWIGRPDEAARIVLIYGPDRGLVAERARKFAAKTGVPLDDPFSVIRIDGADVDADPGRLIDEATMIPMFGDMRLVWLRNVGTQKSIADAVKHLAGTPPADARVLIEAGDLKKGAAGLRGIVEGSSAAMALPCYKDDGRAIDRLIDSELSAANTAITLDARHLLKSSLGGDRLASRGEIEKLLLYTSGQDRIEFEDVMASIGDAAAISVDQAADAIMAGDLESFDTAFCRMVSAGMPAFQALSATMRSFGTLQILCNEMELHRRTPGAVVAAARPPIFFARKKVFENALSIWSARSITRALERLQATVLETRRVPTLDGSLCSRTLLALCVEAAHGKRNISRRT